MKNMLALLLLLAPSIVGAQSAPSREVRGDTLVSGADPVATFVFSEPFRFAGRQTIDILEVALVVSQPDRQRCPSVAFR